MRSFEKIMILINGREGIGYIAKKSKYDYAKRKRKSTEGRKCKRRVFVGGGNPIK